MKFLKQIDHIKDRYAESTILENENLLTRARLIRKNLIADGQLKSLITFKRNFILIFGGFKESALNFSFAKLKNKLTRAKYKRIRYLDSESIVI
jgi:hypothetical protein